MNDDNELTDDDIEKELRGLQWDEISGVKYPANNLPGSLLVKSKGFNTRQDIWSRIQSEADAAITDDSLTVEEKIAQFLASPRGRKLYEAWKRAGVAVYESTSKEDEPVTTLRQHAWAAIQKRAIALTEMRPSLPLPDAVAEILSTDEGKQLYGLYQHRYANRPLEEARQAVLKSTDDATPLLRALNLLVG